MRDNLADHCRESYVGLTGKSINTRTLLGVEIDCWREIAISQVILSNSRSASPPSRRLSRCHVVGSLPARPGHSRDTPVTETTWTNSRRSVLVAATGWSSPTARVGRFLRQIDVSGLHEGPGEASPNPVWTIKTSGGFADHFVRNR